MNSSKFSFIIILVLALVVGFLSYGYLSSAKSIIYLFNDDYSAGQEITNDMLTSAEIDTSVVTATESTEGARYITSNEIDEILGDYLRTDVVVGAPLMSTFSDKISGFGAEKKLAENMVAVTVPADNISAVSPFLQGSSTVNIYTGYTFALDGKDISVMDLTYQNVKVIDVLYDEIYNESSESPSISGVTLELTPEQSVVVQHACGFGEVRLGLVKNGQYEESKVKPHTKDNLNLEQVLQENEDEDEKGESDGQSEDDIDKEQ